jgi:hypothetical protein
MLTTFTLLAAMVAAPVPKDATPPGPPPRILELKTEQDGKVRVQVIRQVKQTVTVNVVVNKNGQQVVEAQQREVMSNISTRVELSEVKDLSIWSADGKEADKPIALKKLSEGAIVVISADGKKVDPRYLKLFRDDVIVLASPELMDRTAPTASGVARPAPLGVNVQALQPIMPAPVPAPPAARVPPVIVQAAPVQEGKVEDKKEVKKEEKKPEAKKEEKKND